MVKRTRFFVFPRLHSVFIENIAALLRLLESSVTIMFIAIASSS